MKYFLLRLHICIILLLFVRCDKKNDVEKVYLFSSFENYGSKELVIDSNKYNKLSD